MKQGSGQPQTLRIFTQPGLGDFFTGLKPWVHAGLAIVSLGLFP
jgi:hypothetical protein